MLMFWYGRQANHPGQFGHHCPSNPIPAQPKSTPHTSPAQHTTLTHSIPSSLADADLIIWRRLLLLFRLFFWFRSSFLLSFLLTTYKIQELNYIRLQVTQQLVAKAAETWKNRLRYVPETSVRWFLTAFIGEGIPRPVAWFLIDGKNLLCYSLTLLTEVSPLLSQAPYSLKNVCGVFHIKNHRMQIASMLVISIPLSRI